MPNEADDRIKILRPPVQPEPPRPLARIDDLHEAGTGSTTLRDEEMFLGAHGTDAAGQKIKDHVISVHGPENTDGKREIHMDGRLHYNPPRATPREGTSYEITPGYWEARPAENSVDAVSGDAGPKRDSSPSREPETRESSGDSQLGESHRYAGTTGNGQASVLGLGLSNHPSADGRGLGMRDLPTAAEPYRNNGETATRADSRPAAGEVKAESSDLHKESNRERLDRISKDLGDAARLVKEGRLGEAWDRVNTNELGQRESVATEAAHSLKSVLSSPKEMVTATAHSGMALTEGLAGHPLPASLDVAEASGAIQNIEARVPSFHHIETDDTVAAQRPTVREIGFPPPVDLGSRDVPEPDTSDHEISPPPSGAFDVKELLRGDVDSKTIPPPSRDAFSEATTPDAEPTVKADAGPKAHSADLGATAPSDNTHQSEAGATDSGPTSQASDRQQKPSSDV